MAAPRMAEKKKGGHRKNSVRIVKGKRILCSSDVHGSSKHINRLVKACRADMVVHVGSFGFFDGDSADGMSAEMSANAAQASHLVVKNTGESSGNENGTVDFSKMDEAHSREVVGSQLSESPSYLAGVMKFDVPVYTIWGDTEDVQVLEKFHNGTYKVPNLHIVDAQNAPSLPGTPIRSLGIPGSFSPPKMFNIGEGSTIPGTHGSTWTGIWQIGESAHTASKTYDQDEVRWLSTSSPTDRGLSEKSAISFRCDAHIFSVDGYSRTRNVTSTYFPNSVMWHVWTYKRMISMAQAGFEKSWSDVSKEVLAACEDDENLKGSITSTVKSLTAEIPPEKVECAYEASWHCSLANNRQSSLLVMLDDKGAYNSEMRNFGVAFHGSESDVRSKNLSSSPSFASSVDSVNNKKGRSKQSTPATESSAQPSGTTTTTTDTSSLPKGPANDASRGSKSSQSEKNDIDAEGNDEDAAVDSATSGDDKDQQSGETTRNTESKDGHDNETKPAERHTSPGFKDHESSDADNKEGSPAAEGGKKFDITNLPTEPSGNNSSKRAEKLKAKKAREQANQNRNKEVEEPAIGRPGLWFKNGDRSPEEILGFLAEEDRKTNPTVKFIKGKPKLNGTTARNALVYFQTEEQASAAYERVNKEEAGTVSIYQPHQTSQAELGANGISTMKSGGNRPFKKFFKQKKRWQHQ